MHFVRTDEILLLLLLRAFQALLFDDGGELVGELVVGPGQLLLQGGRPLGGELGLGVLGVLVGVAELGGVDVVLSLEGRLGRSANVQD